MLGFMDRFKPQCYALLRIVSGFMFAFHGMQKIFGIWSDFRPEFPSQMWVGGMIELLGGLLVMLGLRSRLAAFICSGEMAVAYFQFHWRGQWGRDFFPGINHGETAVLYCFIFLLISAQGSGIWSLDKKTS